MAGILKLSVEWKGPFRPKTVVDRFTHTGERPDFSGNDYGLYQIYGRHILAGPEALLYIGKATDQTFSARFKQHQHWLSKEYPGIRIYLGRLNHPGRHVAKDQWKTWAADVTLAESILIHKYSPHYNSMAISEPPDLSGFDTVEIHHRGTRNCLKTKDIAPRDWT